MLWLLPALTACNLPTPVDRNCAVRQAYYPDENGDGVGEPTEVYIGCSPPDGWVDNVSHDPGDDTDDTDSDSDTDNADSGRGRDTGWGWGTGTFNTPDTGWSGDTSDSAYVAGSCANLCGQFIETWSCQCDDDCEYYGDCCSDYLSVCEP